MNISFRSTRRAADRKAKKANESNPVAEQARIAVNLLEKHIIAFMKNQKTKSVSLDIINLYTGIVVKGANEGVSELIDANEIKLHTFICNEIEIMLGVFGAGCLKYSKEYSSENIPEPVINSFFAQVRKRI